MTDTDIFVLAVLVLVVAYTVFACYRIAKKIDAIVDMVNDCCNRIDDSNLRIDNNQTRAVDRWYDQESKIIQINSKLSWLNKTINIEKAKADLNSANQYVTQCKKKLSEAKDAL